MSLANAHISANIAVTDMDRALAFYRDVLELKTIPVAPWLSLVMSGDNSMLVLAMRQKVASDEDSANFTVADINATMHELKSKGVQFHDYDLPMLKTVNQVAEAGGFKAAWFKDSEGNTLQINQSPAET
ncbi:MAG: VOC family protein [Chloroflexi bacterium]|nr:VOC family protein [Chloroflexota bacterium]